MVRSKKISTSAFNRNRSRCFSSRFSRPTINIPVYYSIHIHGTTVTNNAWLIGSFSAAWARMTCYHEAI